MLRQKGTEAPFTGEYDEVFEPGTYLCAGCGAELFDSDAKYDSGLRLAGLLPRRLREEAIDEETDVEPRHGADRGHVRRAAAGTSGTCSPTGRIRPGCATASIRRR